MNIGIGIDIVNITRIDHVIKKWRDKFLHRVFTKKEINYCVNKKFPSQHFAIRFAAKEAFLKALGMGMRAGIPWNHIEVINTSMGRPSMELHSKAKETCRRRKIKNIHLSLSHDGDYGVALVILEGELEDS